MFSSILRALNNLLFTKPETKAFFVEGIGEFRREIHKQKEELDWSHDYYFPNAKCPTSIVITGDKDRPYKDKIDIVRPFIDSRDEIYRMIDIKLRGAILSTLEYQQKWSGWEKRFEFMIIESFFDDEVLVQIWLRYNPDDLEMWVDFKHGRIIKFEVSE